MAASSAASSKQGIAIASAVTKSVPPHRKLVDFNGVAGLSRSAAGTRQRLLDSAFELIQDCGHVPQFELPALTHRLVRAFLARPR